MQIIELLTITSHHETAGSHRDVIAEGGRQANARMQYAWKHGKLLRTGRPRSKDMETHGMLWMRAGWDAWPWFGTCDVVPLHPQSDGKEDAVLREIRF